MLANKIERKQESKIKAIICKITHYYCLIQLNIISIAIQFSYQVFLIYIKKLNNMQNKKMWKGILGSRQHGMTTNTYFCKQRGFDAGNGLYLKGLVTTTGIRSENSRLIFSNMC